MNWKAVLIIDSLAIQPSFDRFDLIDVSIFSVNIFSLMCPGGAANFKNNFWNKVALLGDINNLIFEIM